MKKYRLLFPVLMLALFATSFGGIFGGATAAPVALVAGNSANISQNQPVSVAASNPGTANVASDQPASQPAKGSKASFDGVDCSRVHALGIDRQMNMRASTIMVGCGFAAGGNTPGGGGGSGSVSSVGPAYGGTDVDAITGAETYPHVTQAESMDWANGNTILINYNDSAGAPNCYSGISYSTNNGASYTRINPFCSGHGTNYGDPVVVYNARQSKWYAGDLATGCGGQGIGLWTSTDGISWATGACPHNGTSDDREAMGVDNNSASPYYGRMYISWNDFANGQNIMLVYSDNGTTWTSVTVHNGGFIRNQNVEGSSDGTVFIYSGDPGSDTIGSARTNHIFRSTNGGASWTDLALSGAGFTGPGDLNCTGGFPAQSPIWRDEGWGQMGVGPNSVIHYVYEAHGSGSDPGDIYYSRSTDNGNTWSAPTKVNTDATSRAQFKPDLAVTSAGGVVISWYDRRSTSNNNYEYWSKVSTDNGVTFAAEQRTSDVVITQPLQPDPNVQACYAGDYDYHFAQGNTVYLSWTDGRVQVSGNNQQDVFTDRITVGSGGGTPTPTNTPGPPTATPTNTPLPTNTPTPGPCGGNVIQNGGFETGSLSPWVVDGTNPSPTVSTAQHHSGSYSVLVGSLNPAGDSSLYQTITVPPGGGTLSFWYWPHTGDTITYDWQDAYVQNTSGVTLATIMHVDSNAQTWVNVTFNMAAYANQTVRIKFLVHDDGYAGDPTYMYVDDVSLGGGSCATPTNTPVPPTPTNTPAPRTPTNTPAPPTPTNTPVACGSVIQNGGFETGSLSSWVIDGNLPTPSASTAQHHSGNYSALLGTPSGGEPNGNSSFYQTITVPAGGGTLSYWYWPLTSDTITYDWQDAYVQDTSGNTLATIMHVDSNARAWTNVTFSLNAYAGRSVRIKFLVHQDGYGDDTAMYVDDVSFACGQLPIAPPPDH